MKNRCDIVQDLLPLYVDGCCTQGSRELVEELTAQAVAALDGFSSRDFLVWLANTLAQRTK